MLRRGASCPAGKSRCAPTAEAVDASALPDPRPGMIGERRAHEGDRTCSVARQTCSGLSAATSSRSTSRSSRLGVDRNRVLDVVQDHVVARPSMGKVFLSVVDDVTRTERVNHPHVRRAADAGHLGSASEPRRQGGGVRGRPRRLTSRCWFGVAHSAATACPARMRSSNAVSAVLAPSPMAMTICLNGVVVTSPAA